jgi:drug/metabolite transporter (DMT)-like permease
MSEEQAFRSLRRAPFIEDRRKTILLFIAAVALLAAMDMIVKFASARLSTPQIVWGRYVAVLTPIVTRVQDPAISIYFLGMIGAASMSAVVPFYWTQPDALGWSMLLVIGVLGTIGHLLIVRAFAHAPAAMLAPFFYVDLIWATIYGWFIFGDHPAWQRSSAAR